MNTVLAQALRSDALEFSERLGQLQGSLHGAETVSNLFARASLAACEFCEFERALVLTIRDGRLLADGSTAVGDAECDRLRRHALCAGIRLAPGTEESEILRRGPWSMHSRLPHRSDVRALLGLRSYLMAPVVPESNTVALLIVDRSAPAVADRDRSAVGLFAHLLGLALERTVLRARLQELCAELRHMTASANALSHEALTAPVSVPANFRWGPTFSSAVGPSGPPPADARRLLTTRELEIVELMVRGRSNRDIANDLALAPNTVKGTVARLLRKLGAANRAEAVGRYLAMQHGNIET